MMNHKHSFLKWAGGKGKVLPSILSVFPSATRIVEPFVGSGIVFLNTDHKEILINDINSDLITTYNAIKENPIDLIAECRKLFVPENCTLEAYNRLRDEFNGIVVSRIRKAALFIYLNKHGYNGLCCYNSKGVFNIPFGKYKNVNFSEDAILTMHTRLSQSEVTIENDDFRKIMKLSRQGDVIYCDPPYIPLSATASFTTYHTHKFVEKDQRDLAALAQEAASIGATVIISNHDTLLSREFYKDATSILEIQCGRSISCKGSERKKVNELIAVYKPSA
jgi:DNA adenine methylase